MRGGGAWADAAKNFPAGREYEPVILRGWQTSTLQSKPINKLIAYRRENGGWVAIPFQIDEREAGRVISADSAQRCSLSIGITNCSDIITPATYVPSGLPNGNGIFDPADELVVMAQDLGDQADTGAAFPVSTIPFESQYFELAVHDPMSAVGMGYGFFYIFVHTTTGFESEKSLKSYVSYTIEDTDPANCAGPIWTPAESCGRLRTYPSGNTSSAWYWQAKWIGNWRLGELAVNGGAANLLDRWKARATLTDMSGQQRTETEDDWDTALCPMFRGYSAGPVRLTRVIQGAQSGVATVKYEFAYAKFFDWEIEYRVHDIGNFKVLFDHLLAASPSSDRLLVDFEGRNGSTEDSIDATPHPSWGSYAPPYYSWGRVKNGNQAFVQLYREGPEIVKTQCSVDPMCPSGGDRATTYSDSTAELSPPTGADPGSIGNIELSFVNLLDNQDRSCAPQDLLFGRITRRVLLYNSSDSTLVDTDQKVGDLQKHFKPENALQTSTAVLGGGGGGTSPCVTPIWTASADTTGESNSIQITQECTPASAGWLLLRKLSTGSTYQVIGPIRPAVVYRDRNVKRGAAYKYTLRSIYGSALLGGTTDEKTVTVTDTTAPLPPTVVLASGAFESVSLSWGFAESADAFKYNVYASEVGGGPYQKLTTVPVLSRNLVISGIPSGQWRYAVVTAVDTSGNESAVSVEAGAQAQ